MRAFSELKISCMPVAALGGMGVVVVVAYGTVHCAQSAAPAGAFRAWRGIGHDPTRIHASTPTVTQHCPTEGANGVSRRVPRRGYRSHSGDPALHLLIATKKAHGKWNLYSFLSGDTAMWQSLIFKPHAQHVGGAPLPPLGLMTTRTSVSCRRCSLSSSRLCRFPSKVHRAVCVPSNSA